MTSENNRGGRCYVALRCGGRKFHDNRQKKAK